MDGLALELLVVVDKDASWSMKGKAAAIHSHDTVNKE